MRDLSAPLDFETIFNAARQLVDVSERLHALPPGEDLMTQNQLLLERGDCIQRLQSAPWDLLNSAEQRQLQVLMDTAMQLDVQIQARFFAHMDTLSLEQSKLKQLNRGLSHYDSQSISQSTRDESG
ncbi:MAG: hypothetical protein K2X01_08850 [Cyanobacteria bacterium]|nr:hypothetical protein [Cyanobacteriota bacterium]